MSNEFPGDLRSRIEENDLGDEYVRIRVPEVVARTFAHMLCEGNFFHIVLTGPYGETELILKRGGHKWLRLRLESLARYIPED